MIYASFLHSVVFSVFSVERALRKRILMILFWDQLITYHSHLGCLVKASLLYFCIVLLIESLAHQPPIVPMCTINILFNFCSNCHRCVLWNTQLSLSLQHQIWNSLILLLHIKTWNKLKLYCWWSVVKEFTAGTLNKEMFSKHLCFL